MKYECERRNCKQLQACCVEVLNYPEWITNIVPILMKEGKVRMCVDYKDLNKASTKDGFPVATSMSSWIIQLVTLFLLHKWFIRLHSNLDAAKRSGENFIHHFLGDLLYKVIHLV